MTIKGIKRRLRKINYKWAEKLFDKYSDAEILDTITSFSNFIEKVKDIIISVIYKVMNRWDNFINKLSFVLSDIDLENKCANSSLGG